TYSFSTDCANGGGQQNTCTVLVTFAASATFPGEWKAEVVSGSAGSACTALQTSFTSMNNAVDAVRMAKGGSTACTFRIVMRVSPLAWGTFAPSASAYTRGITLTARRTTWCGSPRT